MRRAARIDANQPEIVSGLRAIGASVQPLHMVGEGCPDLLVAWRGTNWLLEVKLPLGPHGGKSDRELTPQQRGWHLAWRGPVRIVRSLGDALDAIGAARNRPQEARSAGG